jgi:hypothetical protein
VQDRQRLLPGPVAQQHRRPQQVLPVPPAVHVHRPRDGRLDVGPLVEQSVASSEFAFRVEGNAADPSELSPTRQSARLRVPSEL